MPDTFTLEQIEAELQNPSPVRPCDAPSEEEMRRTVAQHNLKWTPRWLSDEGRWTLASIIRSRVLGDHAGAGEIKTQWEEMVAKQGRR